MCKLVKELEFPVKSDIHPGQIVSPPQLLLANFMNVHKPKAVD